jgi:hypothetical protein
MEQVMTFAKASAGGGGGVVAWHSDTQPIPLALQTFPFEPVQLERSITLSKGESARSEVILTVPQAKTLILEFVSVSCAASSDRVVRAEVGVVGAGQVFVPLSRPNEASALTGAEEVTLYAQAGQNVSISYRNNNSEVAGTRRATFTVVGRLVDAT